MALVLTLLNLPFKLGSNFLVIPSSSSSSLSVGYKKVNKASA